MTDIPLIKVTLPFRMIMLDAETHEIVKTGGFDLIKEAAAEPGRYIMVNAMNPTLVGNKVLVA